MGREAPRPQPSPSASTPLASPAPKAPLPREIGGFQIQRVLGSGGMATVYAALQKQPRRVVALKVIKAGVANESTLRRFKREIEILGKLHHPYIAQVYGAGIHEDGSEGGGGVPYFVMEYIPGAKTILEYTAAKDLDLRDRIKLFVKVCAAIDHGHRNKIIHRDLKPGNILIDELGEPKIIDFGIARAADLDIASQTLHADSGSGGLVGTLKYMAPEQVDSTPQDLDPRCDVYALGALLYKLVTNQLPHDLSALSVYEAVRIIREETPQPPGAVNPDIRGDLETIILKAMERDRTRRYRNAGSLGRDLVRYLTNKPINARRAGIVYRVRLFAQRNRSIIITAATMVGVLALAVGIVVFGRMQRRSEKQPSVAAQPPPPVQSQPAAASPTFSSAPPATSFTLEGHTGRIAKLAFVAQSKLLISGSYDHTAILWDLSTHAPRFTFNQFKSPVMHVVVSSNGSAAALASNNGPIVVVDVQTGAVNHTLNSGGRTIQSLALNSAGDRIAYSFDDLTVRSSSIDGSSEMVLRSTTGAFDCISFSLDGSQIAAGANSGDIYIWDASDGAQRARLNQLRGPVAAIGFIAPPLSYTTSSQSSGFGEASTQHAQEVAEPAPTRLIAILQDGSAAIWTWPLSSEPAVTSNWNVLTGSSERGSHPLMDARLDPGSRWLACADATQIRLWDVTVDPPLELQTAPLKPREAPYAIAIDSIPSWCAVGQINGDIAIYSASRTR